MKKYNIIYENDLRVGKAGQHLVCVDLLKRNLDAFLADEGLGFDVLLDLKGSLKRIQVKTTTASKDKGKSKSVYRFYIRNGKGAKRSYNTKSFDIIAFVFLDLNKVAYMNKKEFTSLKTGEVLQCVDFTNKDAIRNLKRIPKKEVRALQDFDLERALSYYE